MIIFTSSTCPSPTVDQCMSCGALRGRHYDDCSDFATQPIVYPTWDRTATMETLEMPAEPPARVRRGYTGPVACIALGFPLMAVGAFFRHEAASVVWSWLR